MLEALARQALVVFQMEDALGCNHSRSNGSLSRLRAGIDEQVPRTTYSLFSRPTRAYLILVQSEIWAIETHDLAGFYVICYKTQKITIAGRPRTGMSLRYNHRMEDLHCVLAEDSVVVLVSTNISIIAI